MPGAPRLPQTTRLPRGALLGAGALVAFALAGCSTPAPTTAGPGSTLSSSSPSAPASSSGSSSGSPSGSSTTTRTALSAPTDAATRLKVPWGTAVLPDGAVLVSERDTGLVKRIPAGGGALETV